MTAPRPVAVRARTTARTGALLTACGALLVSGLQAAPEARAEASAAEWGTEISAGSGNGHSESCTVEGSGSVSGGGEMGGGDTVDRPLSSVITVANSDDAADTQRFAVDSDSQWRLRDAGGTFRELGFTMDATIAATTALDETDCFTRVDVESYIGGEGEVPSAGFLELGLDTSDDMTAELSVGQPGTTGATLSAGPDSARFRRGATGSVRVFVEPGEFFYQAYAELEMLLPDDRSGGGPMVIQRQSDLDRTETGAVAATVTFVAAGSATRPRGPGKRFVRLQARNCATDAVRAGFTPRAGKVRRAVFSVDGARKKTVKQPKGGRLLVIKRLGASDDVTVSATMTLKNGATRTVSRSYVACSG